MIKNNNMPVVILFAICLNFIFLNAQSQTVRKQICSHAWQQRSAASAIWSFEENGHFAAILVWVNKKKSGFIAKKGIFSLDSSTKIIRINFDSTYGAYSTDSVSVNKNVDLQEWHLLTVTDYKIVLSRPPIWEFEKRSAANNSKDMIVTLVRSKKRKNNPEHKV